MKNINENNDFEKNLFSQVENKPEVFIANLIKDLEIKYFDDYPESTFFVNKETGDIWMEDNKKIGYLLVSYRHIWKKIESSFQHKDLNTKELIKYVVKFIFKMDVGTPRSRPPVFANWWRLLTD